MSMFCRQCEQTFRWKGCETMGVCGKDPEVAALQDVLIHACKGLAVCGQAVRDAGNHDNETDYLLMEGVFATLTNVNFDPDALEDMIRRTVACREQLRSQYSDLFTGDRPAAVQWLPAADRQGILDQAPSLGILCDGGLDNDLRSLRELLLYGLKGMAAYAHHAYRLGETDAKVTKFLYKGMAALADLSLDMGALLGLVMECGEANLTCLEILDHGHTARFGHPEPTLVKLGYLKGPAIVVSGHDLHDLEQLLVQTEGKGINIFTHGEMLPGNAYPGLKKYQHLAGHYGTAWQNQQKEFVNLPAAILMTTNCIQEPDMTYQDRIFTTGAVGWPNIAHIAEGEKGRKDFTPVIERALALGGFTEDNVEKEITIGFGHHTILSHADQIVAAVKSGEIRHFFLIGGCDGARPGRNYYTK
ncbi:MAG: hydroxylamine reductase, partial [Candidatus Omnitrophica bacterium]|nr:hydroxylamine reductase [Candidatus Omnitrophota bacterium]